MMNSWEHNQEQLEMTLHTLSQCPLCRLTDFNFNFKIAEQQSMWSIFDIFINVAMPRKHCDIFARRSDGIDVHNDLETSSKWTGTVQIMKKDSDFRSGWRLCFPGTKENKTTQHAVYLLPAL